MIPQLTKEVNENKNFARLRQVYNSLILAAWYKKKIKDSILAQVYADKNKVAGVQYTSTVIPETVGIRFKNDVEGLYQEYLKAFKKGVYNYIKEEQDPVTQETIPRKYFSGGFNAAMITPVIKYVDKAQLPQQGPQGLVDVAMRADPVKDLAMTMPELTSAQKNAKRRTLLDDYLDGYKYHLDELYSEHRIIYPTLKGFQRVLQDRRNDNLDEEALGKLLAGIARGHFYGNRKEATVEQFLNENPVAWGMVTKHIKNAFGTGQYNLFPPAPKPAPQLPNNPPNNEAPPAKEAPKKPEIKQINLFDTAMTAEEFPYQQVIDFLARLHRANYDPLFPVHIFWDAKGQGHWDGLTISQIRELYEKKMINALTDPQRHIQFVWNPGARNEWAKDMVLSQFLFMPKNRNKEVRINFSEIIQIEYAGGDYHKIWIEDNQVRWQYVNKVGIPIGSARNAQLGDKIEEKEFNGRVIKNGKNTYKLYIKNKVGLTVKWQAKPEISFSYDGHILKLPKVGDEKKSMEFVDAVRGALTFVKGQDKESSIAFKVLNDEVERSQKLLLDQVKLFAQEAVLKAEREILKYQKSHPSPLQNPTDMTLVFVRQDSKGQGYLIMVDTGHNHLYLRRQDSGKVENLIKGNKESIEEKNMIIRKVSEGDSVIVTAGIDYLGKNIVLNAEDSESLTDQLISHTKNAQGASVAVLHIKSRDFAMTANGIIDRTKYFDKTNGTFNSRYYWVDGTEIPGGTLSHFGHDLESVWETGQEIVSDRTWVKFEVTQSGKSRDVYGHWDGQKWETVEGLDWGLYTFMVNKETIPPEGGIDVTRKFDYTNGTFYNRFYWVDGTIIPQNTVSHFGHNLAKVWALGKEIVEGSTWVKFKVTQKNGKGRDVYGHWDGQEQNWKTVEGAEFSKARAPGGIDLTPGHMNLRTHNNGGEIKVRLDPAMFKQLQNALGFVPVIINIQPVNNLREFLGLNQEIEKLT